MNKIYVSRNGIISDSNDVLIKDNVIKLLNEQDRPMVFILWGRNAISKTKYLNNPKHLVLTSVHPSPLSAYNGFFGSKPFQKPMIF